MNNRLNTGEKFAIAAFVMLAINTFWFMNNTATNLLKGDDWRFLIMFYKKWIDGTFAFRDLFSDQHPIALHPLVYLFNAEYLSLQRIYTAWFGLLLKILAGVLLLWKIFSNGTPVSSRLLSVLFPLAIVLLYFGMNETTEYFWPLLTYQNGMTFCCGLAVLALTDSLISRANMFKAGFLVFAMILLSLLSLLLMGTMIKLFFLASISALLIVALVERRVTLNIMVPTFILSAGIVMHSVFISVLGIPKHNGYAASLDNVTQLLVNWYDNLSYVSYGLAAGIARESILHYPGAGLSLLALTCLIIVACSIYVYFRERMWEISIIPIVLVIYMMMVFMGALVFRSDEAVSGSWPLYIPRYFPVYHMGWIGVVWIYYNKFRLAKHRGRVSMIAVPLLVVVLLMLSGIKHAWNASPNIASANNKAEIAVCKYAKGDQEAAADIPMSIGGHSFSLEGVLLLKERGLSIFSADTPGYHCTD